MARNASGNDKQNQPRRSAADRARLKAIRAKYEHRPTLDDLIASGKFEGPFHTGTFLSLRVFCSELKGLRQAAGLTLEELSEKTGMTIGALSMLENGRNGNPTIDTLGRWAAALGKSVTLDCVDSRPEEEKERSDGGQQGGGKPSGTHPSKRSYRATS